MNKNTFYANNYNANFFTGGKSMIHLEGTPRVFFSDETFTNNGDMCKEAITTYATYNGITILTAAPGEMTISTVLSSPGSYSSTTLG